WNHPPPRPRGSLPRKRPRQPPRQKRPLLPPNKPSRSMLRPRLRACSGNWRVQDPAMTEGIAKRRDPGAPKRIHGVRLALGAETGRLREYIVDHLGLGIFQADGDRREFAR